MRFAGRVAVVTGSSDGIGLATAVLLAAEGAQVVLNARGAERLDSARREVAARGVPPLVIAADVSRPDAVRMLVAETVERFRRIDVLVNNAGGGTAVRDLEGVTDEEWARVVDGNLTSAFLCCRAVAPIMKAHRFGRIVNVASLAGRNVSKLSGPPYTAAKAGMLGLTRHLAQDLGPSGITVNAVAPGVVMVPRVRAKWDARSEEDRRRIVEGIPLGRVADPDDVAPVIAFLASDDARYVTGVTVDVNGGAFMA
jgi:NAD(P)-dependent dehydrogenase (short-subunit alcohol dehydrogenase family)